MKSCKTTSTTRRWPQSILFALLLAGAPCLFAQDFHIESAGARYGFDPVGSESNFHQAEAFVNFDLPWNWDLGKRWSLQSRLDASAGWLGESGADAFIGTVGPSLSLGKQNFPLSLEGGVSPTILSRKDFPSRDFGTLFQFTSHGGINLDITSHWRLSYRFQHMSNASISRHNPGLNLHMFGLSYLF